MVNNEHNRYHAGDGPVELWLAYPGVLFGCCACRSCTRSFETWRLSESGISEAFFAGRKPPAVSDSISSSGCGICIKRYIRIKGYQAWQKGRDTCSRS